jgi:hypothetical protein
MAGVGGDVSSLDPRARPQPNQKMGDRSSNLSAVLGSVSLFMISGSGFHGSGTGFCCISHGSGFGSGLISLL